MTVNAVSPGFIETDMTASELPEQRRGEVLKAIPLAASASRKRSRRQWLFSPVPGRHT